MFFDCFDMIGIKKPKKTHRKEFKIRLLNKRQHGFKSEGAQLISSDNMAAKLHQNGWEKLCVCEGCGGV